MLAGRTGEGSMQEAVRSEEHTSELQSHSDLHSFPTRRSSDLRGSARSRGPPRPLIPGSPLLLLVRFRGRDVATVEGTSAPRTRPTRLRVAAEADVCSPDARGRGPCRKQSDRKSTRLNSSHTVIFTLSLHDALPIYEDPHVLEGLQDR